MELAKGLRRWAQRAKGAGQLLLFKPDAPTSPAANLSKWATKTPNATFLMFEGERWSYRQFEERVAHRAAVFEAQGLNHGDVVALMMDNRPAFLVNSLALSRIGATPALINTKLVATGLRHAALVCQPVAAVVGAEHLDAWVEAFGDRDTGLIQWVDHEDGRLPPEDVPDGMVDLVALDLDSPQTRAQLVEQPGTELAAFIYTSGTTGLPKAGRVLNARCDMAAIGFGLATTGMNGDDVYYCCLPMFHSNGFLVALGCVLYSGATLALARKFSASRFWDDISDVGATCFIYIGEVCRYLLNTPQHPREQSHNLRFITGNGMRPEVWRQFVERFAIPRVHEFYGATEGNVNMINMTGREGSVGRLPPLPGLDNTLLVRFDHDTQMPIRDAKGRCIPCKRGEVGELLGQINPDKVTQRFDGYLNREATRKKVLRDVVKPGDAWFRSGDLLKKDWLGYYYFVDRIGDTFRWKGENVSTNSVGDAVQRFGAIDIANTYGVKVPGADGRAGMVTVVLTDGAELDPDAFYAHVAEELPPFAQPAFVRIADGAQLTATFKLRKVDLVEDGFNPEKVTDPIYVRDDLAGTYVRIDSEIYDKILAGEIRL